MFQYGKTISDLFEAANEAASESSDAETLVGAASQTRLHGKYLTAANTFIHGAKDIGLPNTRPDKHKFMVHAEQNLVYRAAREGISLKDSIVVCTLSPCQNCLRTLWQAGVKEIYFKTLYEKHDIDMDDLTVIQVNLGNYYKITLKAKNGAK